MDVQAGALVNQVSERRIASYSFCEFPKPISPIAVNFSKKIVAVTTLALYEIVITSSQQIEFLLQ